MDVQFQQLRYLLEVVEAGSFTRAASTLHVAQPSVSSAIRALERELGAPLLHRSRGAVTTTVAGETFLPWARHVLADCEAGRAAVRELLGLRGGRVAIGATPSLATSVLPGVLGQFHRRYPEVGLTLHEAGSQDLVNRLEQAQLDLALVILPVTPHWVHATPLYDEDLLVVVNPEHPLAVRASVPVAALRDVPLVMFRDGYDLKTTTVAACQQAGFEPVWAVDGPEMDGVLALTAAGLGAAVLPRSALLTRSDLRAVRFDEPGIHRTVGVARRRDRILSRAGQAFLDQLCSSLSSAS